ncbi:MAG TPA: hypothetical protein VEJ46_11745 [Candidatus Acidoferrum sp.]|nr:hypothetical protein [Candidatus Acidoferrum sp.]
MRKAGGILFLLLVTMGLGGCLWFRVGAPCSGFGCPAFTPKSSAQLQQAPAQTAQQASHHHFNPFAQKAQAQSDAAPAPSAKSGQ